jgi:hypothetical protein
VRVPLAARSIRSPSLLKLRARATAESARTKSRAARCACRARAESAIIKPGWTSSRSHTGIMVMAASAALDVRLPVGTSQLHPMMYSDHAQPMPCHEVSVLASIHRR